MKRVLYHALDKLSRARIARIAKLPESQNIGKPPDMTLARLAQQILCITPKSSQDSGVERERLSGNQLRVLFQYSPQALSGDWVQLVV